MTGLLTAQTPDDRARALLKRAAAAAEQLEADIAELVATRAWDALGYENFNQMWLAEVGHEPPKVVKVLAIGAMAKEEERSEDGWRHRVFGRPNRQGHWVPQIVRQLDHDVPPDLATIPNWREGPGVFRDDAGVALNPIDFGKVPGEKITASYVREHPEMPWPQWMIEQAGVVRTDGEDQ